MYELHGVGRHGKQKPFEKPWAMTCVMFLGMSLCLPLAYYQQFQAAKKKRVLAEAEQPLMNGGEVSPGTHYSPHLPPLLPLLHDQQAPFHISFDAALSRGTEGEPSWQC